MTEVQFCGVFDGHDLAIGRNESGERVQRSLSYLRRFLQRSECSISSLSQTRPSSHIRIHSLQIQEIHDGQWITRNLLIVNVPFSCYFTCVSELYSASITRLASSIGFAMLMCFPARYANLTTKESSSFSSSKTTLVVSIRSVYAKCTVYLWAIA